MADLAFRVQHVIKTEIDVTQAQFSRNNVDLITGKARFVDPHTCGCRTRAGVDDRGIIVIATGTKPAPRPRFPSTGAPSSTAIRSCRCRNSRKL